VAVGAQLMDQARTGIGNVYRAEILFRHRISPGVQRWPALPPLRDAGQPNRDGGSQPVLVRRLPTGLRSGPEQPKAVAPGHRSGWQRGHQ
jgi:hypothetical protein